jgi:hypothetical protein
MNPFIHQQIIMKIRKLSTLYECDPQTTKFMVHLCQTSVGNVQLKPVQVIALKIEQYQTTICRLVKLFSEEWVLN